MMRNLVTVFCVVFLLAGSAWALEFSADTVMSHKGEAKTNGKIYFKTDRFRMDMKSPAEMITISRMDRKVVWSIMPREKMYMEMPFDMKNKPMVENKMEGEIERKQVGTETIDGHPTRKYLITYTVGGRKDQMYQWFATDLNFPVKSAAVDGSWIQEYKNIKTGPQPNSLFEVPSGYKKMQMPGMNLKMN